MQCIGICMSASERDKRKMLLLLEPRDVAKKGTTNERGVYGQQGEIKRRKRRRRWN